MKAAIIVPARNKEKYVAQTVRTVLAQNYSPLELIFSDQDSTDNTLEEIEKACSEYHGPNEVRILKCPIKGPVGMSGLNAHQNWLNQQTDADIIIQTSADDLDHPNRAAKTIEAYERFNPSCVHTLQSFLNSDLETVGFTAHPLASGFVSGSDDITYMVGSSSSMSWMREFYEKVGGIHGITCPDVYLPYLATQDKGLYYLYENVHAYVQNNSDQNTGLEGVYRSSDDDDHKMQVSELMHFQICNTFRQIAFKCQEDYPDWNEEDRQVLLKTMVEQSARWAEARYQLTIHDVPPIPMRI